MRETTEIRLNERGDEAHESWILIGAHHYTSTGTRLFDSEIPHQNFIGVQVKRCSRKRDLNRDWLHAETVLLEMQMSQAQWGAFVSSFGQGDGVPATLTYLINEGHVPSAPAESRFEKSFSEVRESGDKALAKVTEALQEVEAAFDNNDGRRVLREKLRNLHYAVQNTPANMEYAAKSLTEHAENVVTKAKADIEAMALAAVEHGELAQSAAQPQLGSGSDSYKIKATSRRQHER